MAYILAFVGAVLGSLSGINGGFLLGAALGFIAGVLWRQNSTIKTLKDRIDDLEGGDTAAAAISGQRPVQPASATTAGVSETSPSSTVTSPPSSAPTPQTASPATPGGAASSADHAREVRKPPPPGQPSAIEDRWNRLRELVVKFVTTGNPVVRIGAVVLFIGVAYLLRYAYEHSMVPAELRLAGAGVGGIALLVFGWRLRERADTYGLILQGVGLAILYLTVFASSRLYELLPMSAAFVILVALVAGASVLAVVQKSQALAIFSMSGGFLAPVLTSTGEGSHIALFSYYALLNSGILVMAWFRHWRWLNWTGFVFTFVIGASWGYQYYEPRYFASTEPFLILFFFFYLAVSMMFARRQTVELKGVIDGTLVFGTPVIAFALQAALVRDMSFGLAYSALGAALVYTALGFWLSRQGKIEGLLDRSFIALAVVFATLAIPFAFDNQRFTAATWALEGAGIYWVGLHQAQRLPRAFGLLLQLAAGVAFAAEFGRAADATMFLNSAFMGAAFLGLAGVYTASLIGRNRESILPLEIPVGWALLGWGVFWWLLGGAREFSIATPGEARFAATNIGEHLFLIYAALSLALLTFFAKSKAKNTAAKGARWPEGLQPGFLLLPLALAVLMNLDIHWERGTALADFGWLAWPLMLGVFLWHLRQVGETARLAAPWHAGGWWFFTLLVTWNLAAMVDGVLAASVWTYVLWGAVPLAASVLLVELKGRDSWPFNAFEESYFGWGWLIAFAYLLTWLLFTGIIAGDPTPIPYLVLVNPLELVQLGILLLGVFWARRLTGTSSEGLQRPVLGVVAGAAFVWINFVAIRAVHFYADVAYPAERIAESDTFQTTVTILWTGIAFVLMGFGTRRAVRLFWIVGAGLLGIVILKLFLVDMGNLELVGRIVSFITVGVLMLVIGYFAPIPPKRLEETSS